MARFYDTMIAAYLENSGNRKVGLDALASELFYYDMQSYKDITNKTKLNFKDVELERAGVYSAEDVVMTHKLYEQQKNTAIFNDRVLRDIELPLMEVLQKMETNGVKIDRVRLKEIGLLLQKELQKLETSIYDEAGEEFNINSPKQVGEILFEKLGLPKGKKTKTGYSVSASVLTNLASDYPIAEKIVDYRHFSKLLSTYVRGLEELLDSDDFLHTSYNQTVTTTGRLSSTNPNLQNIPTGQGVASEIRSAFISRFPEGEIVAIDYSQVEVRLLALIAEDENLLEAFASGEDIHEKTGKFLFPGEVITSDKRKIAKAVNFGVIYGISPFGLTQMIDINLKDARRYIDTFYEAYKGVESYFSDTVAFAEKNGYVETIYGRKRFIPNIKDRNKILKNAAEREAINMPIQGTSADIIKLAMIACQKFIEQEGLQTKMIMQVHDELVFDVPKSETKKIKTEMKKIMESILESKKILLKTDVEFGKNWKDLSLYTELGQKK